MEDDDHDSYSVGSAERANSAEAAEKSDDQSTTSLSHRSDMWARSRK